MTQSMTAMTGSNASAAAGKIGRPRHAWMLRRMVGFAIVAGGFAVLGAQALQHLLGA